MATTNTIYSFQSLAVGGTGTTIKNFGSYLPIPGSGRINGKLMKVSVSGSVTTGATATATIALLWSATPTGSTTTLGTVTSGSLTAGSYPYEMDAEFLIDNVSGDMTGKFGSIVSTTVTGAATLSNEITGLSTATEPVGYVSAAVTFSVSNAGNAATAAELQLSTD